jgi:hypothetical protein
METWKTLDFHKAQVRTKIFFTRASFLRAILPDMGSSFFKNEKKVEAKRLSRPSGTISKLVGIENSNLFLNFVFYALGSSRKSNICCFPELDWGTSPHRF